MTHISSEGEIQLLTPDEAMHTAKLVCEMPPTGYEVDEVDLLVNSLRVVSDMDPTRFPIDLTKVPELAGLGVEEQDEVAAVDMVLGSMKKIKRVKRPPRDPLKVFARYFLSEIQLDTT